MIEHECSRTDACVFGSEVGATPDAVIYHMHCSCGAEWSWVSYWPPLSSGPYNSYSCHHDFGIGATF